jgi:hypothetical protein
MKTIRRLFERLPKPKAAWAAIISLVLIVALLWLASVIWAFAEPCIGRNCPEWAWQHGTPEMQRSAALVLKDQIMGMDIKAVVALLGPGADGWPERYSQDFTGDGVVGFNVRASYKNGLDVSYEDGKVVFVFYFD